MKKTPRKLRILRSCPQDYERKKSDIVKSFELPTELKATDSDCLPLQTQFLDYFNLKITNKSPNYLSKLIITAQPLLLQEKLVKHLRKSILKAKFPREATTKTPLYQGTPLMTKNIELNKYQRKTLNLKQRDDRDCSCSNSLLVRISSSVCRPFKVSDTHCMNFPTDMIFMCVQNTLWFRIFNQY